MGDDDPGGGPRILVSNRQTLPLDEAALVRLARATLVGEGVGAAELSLSFVSDPEMQQLHERYTDERGPTDVLSFPMDGSRDDTSPRDGVPLLGDVVIAPAVAGRNNPGNPEAELRLLLVHGILHLLGYDHERDADRTAMWERQTHHSGAASP